MAVLDHGTRIVGEVVALFPQDDGFTQVHIEAPDGQTMLVTRPSAQPARLSLYAPGEWAYRWSDDDKGTLAVEAAPPVERGSQQPRWRLDA